MTGLEHHAGFNLTTNKLQLVEVVLNNDEFIVENVDEVYLNDSINLKEDKETKIISILQASFDELLIKKPLASKAVSFSLPLELFLTHQFPIETSLLQLDSIEEFRWEFSVLYPHLKMNDFVFQYYEVEKNRIYDYNSAIVSCIPRKVLQILHTFCKSNNQNLRFVDNAHFASDKTIDLNQNYVLNGLTLSLYISDKYLSIEILEGALPIFYKSVLLNSAGELVSTVNALFESPELPTIRKSMMDSVFLSGDELSLSFIHSFEESIGIRTFPVQTFGKISVNSKLFDAKYYLDKYFIFSSAAGMSFRLA